MFKLITLILLFSGCAHKVQKTLPLSGQTYKSGYLNHQYKDTSATVVVFVSAYCPCSNSHIPLVKELKSKHPNLTFIGVHSNANEVKTKAKKYFTEKDLGFPIIRDESGDIARSFGAVKTPHAFIVDSHGEIIYRGAITDASNAKTSTKNFLEQAIEDFQAGRTPTVASKKTLGCYIELKEKV